MTDDDSGAAPPDDPGVRPEDLGLGSLFWKMRDAVQVTNAASGRVVLWNPAAERLTGYPASEAVGRPVWELFPEPERSRVRADVEAYGATGQGPRVAAGVPFETLALRKTGPESFETIVIEVTLSTIADARMPGRYVLATMRDVTERVRLETALREANAFQEHLIASGPIMMWRADPATQTTTYVSPNVERLLGYAPAELLGVPGQWLERIHPDDLPRVLAELQHAVRGRATATEQEFRTRHKDGSYRWVRNFTRMVYDADGQMTEVLGYQLDITEQVQTEVAVREVQQHEARLEGVRLAAVELAHLLNNGLSVPVGVLSLLAERPDLPAGFAGLVRDALAALDKASGDIDQLSRVVRFETKETLMGPALDLERSTQPETD